MEDASVHFIEVFLDEVGEDGEELEPTETYWVTPSVFLRVSADLDPRLLIAVIDAICAC